ncbi:hypothetical protein PoB_005797400 [Plakobranchus ocellatus]|uniref:Uncharacterized protein n=1 Tax=Plakobranchus ocellatus TaxID=259542 RepID=A0AAV4CKL7_9GAST|nr:hypothetical protein PoB_005797400 [Plakobranchus ocellatus]
MLPLYFLLLATKSIDAQLSNVKVEGPITGYLFEDTRDCVEGRILLGITNDNSFEIDVEISDPKIPHVYVSALTVQPGLTVVPWQLGGQSYAENAQIKVTTTAQGLEYSTDLTLVVKAEPTMTGVADAIEVGELLTIVATLVTIYDADFTLWVYDASGNLTHSEVKNVVGPSPSPKQATFTWTPQQDGVLNISVGTTANGDQKFFGKQVHAYYPIPPGTFELSTSNPIRPPKMYYPRDNIEFILKALSPSGSRPTQVMEGGIGISGVTTSTLPPDLKDGFPSGN